MPVIPARWEAEAKKSRATPQPKQVSETLFQHIKIKKKLRCSSVQKPCVDSPTSQKGGDGWMDRREEWDKGQVELTEERRGRRD